MAKYTKQELLDNIKSLNRELGRTPTSKDLTYPSISPYRKVFGSWNNVLKHVGFRPFVRQKYTKEALLENIRTLNRKLGRKPTSKDLTTPNMNSYRRVFGSWNNALMELGLPVTIAKKYTKEKLIQILRQIYAETGKTPSKRGINALKGYPNTNTFDAYFGSWNKAVKAAGLKPNKGGSRKKKAVKVHKRESMPESKKKKSFWRNLFGK